MRQVTIKQLRDNLSKELESVPFLITKNGKPVAKCTQYRGGVHNTLESVQNLPERVEYYDPIDPESVHIIAGGERLGKSVQSLPESVPFDGAIYEDDFVVSLGKPIDADDFLSGVERGLGDYRAGKMQPLETVKSRYDRPPLNLSKEAQAKGVMGH